MVPVSIAHLACIASWIAGLPFIKGSTTRNRAFVLQFIAARWLPVKSVIGKKEIALLGDTMNTTARIESAARDLGESIVLSDDLVKRFPDTLSTPIRALPAYEAAGKQDKLALWAVELPKIHPQIRVFRGLMR